MWGTNRPLQIVSQSALRVRWNRDNNAAVIFTESEYNCFTNIIYLGAGGEYSVDSVECEEPPYTNVFFDFSANGHRILYNSPSDDRTQNKLMIWEIENFSSAKTTLVNTDGHLIKVSHITGAGFSPRSEDQIVYIDDTGIVQYWLSDGDSQVMNPVINAAWVDYGLFSPDNRYVAVLSAKNLYVIPTGIEKS
jgi:hypothetical protein